MKIYIVTAECIYDYEQGPMEAFWRLYGRKAARRYDERNL